MGRPGELTDNEGGLIALILRREPISAYQIAKEYDRSPIYTFNTAKGKLYPLLQRLVDRELLSSEQVPHDRRGTHLYSCTEAGRAALKCWVRSFRPEHELPPDPLRRKLQAFELLRRDEQLAWVEDARARLTRKLEAVENYDVEPEGPFARFARESAQEELLARLRWLDRLELSLGTERVHICKEATAPFGTAAS